MWGGSQRGVGAGLEEGGDGERRHGHDGGDGGALSLSAGRRERGFGWIGERLKFAEAETACLALGGRQEPPSGEEEVVKVSERFQDFKIDCDSKFWVPVRQQAGR